MITSPFSEQKLKLMDKSKITNWSRVLLSSLFLLKQGNLQHHPIVGSCVRMIRWLRVTSATSQAAQVHGLEHHRLCACHCHMTCSTRCFLAALRTCSTAATIINPQWRAFPVGYAVLGTAVYTS